MILIYIVYKKQIVSYPIYKQHVIISLIIIMKAYWGVVTMKVSKSHQILKSISLGGWPTRVASLYLIYLLPEIWRQVSPLSKTRKEKCFTVSYFFFLW
jgi:hypothetical protein